MHEPRDQNPDPFVSVIIVCWNSLDRYPSHRLHIAIVHHDSAYGLLCTNFGQHQQDFVRADAFQRLWVEMVGVLGEYVGRTYSETKHRPRYIVQETVNFPADTIASDFVSPLR